MRYDGIMIRALEAQSDAWRVIEDDLWEILATWADEEGLGFPQTERLGNALEAHFDPGKSKGTT